jgi:ribosomal-protein-alanine N-acetyltransferase
MKLRGAGAEEAPRLAEIHATAFAHPWRAEELAGFMAERGAFALAAESQGEIAGFILCRTIAGEAEVLTLAVRPELRRQGAGRALLEAAMQTSAPFAGAMLLEVAADNPAAIALYRQVGFEPVGRRAAYYVSGRTSPADALVMRRPLNS